MNRKDKQLLAEAYSQINEQGIISNFKKAFRSPEEYAARHNEFTGNQEISPEEYQKITGQEWYDKSGEDNPTRRDAEEFKGGSISSFKQHDTQHISSGNNYKGEEYYQSGVSSKPTSGNMATRISSRASKNSYASNEKGESKTHDFDDALGYLRNRNINVDEIISVRPNPYGTGTYITFKDSLGKTHEQYMPDLTGRTGLKGAITQAYNAYKNIPSTLSYDIQQDQADDKENAIYSAIAPAARAVGKVLPQGAKNLIKRGMEKLGN